MSISDPLPLVQRMTTIKKIDIFPWCDHFNTGIASIDEQHHRLVDIINELASRFAYDADHLNLNSIFNELIDYTRYHFDSEEQIWSTYFAEDQAEALHHQTHIEFIETLQLLIAQQQGKPSQEIAENALGFLVQWLASHILESDRYMAYCVHAIQTGHTPEEAKKIAREKMANLAPDMIKVIMRTYKILSQNTLQLMQEMQHEQQIQQDLIAQEALLRHVIEQIPNMFMVKDQKGRYVIANQALANFYNTTPDKMLGKHDSELGVPAEIANAVFQNSLSIMQTGQTKIVYEDRKDAKTGELRHFKSIKKPFYDHHQQPQILVIAQDITDEIQIKETLQHQRSFLKTLIQTIPDLIWLKDPQGIYLACNSRVEDLFAAKEEDIIGKTDYDLLEKNQADFFRKYDLAAMESSSPSVNEEWVTFANDGHQELLETTKTPMYDAQGTLIGVLGVGHNITQQRQSEAQLKQSEESFRSLFNSLAEAVCVQDETGTIVAVNQGASRMYQQPTDWFVGKTLMDISDHSTDPDMLLSMLQQTLAGQPQLYEHLGIRADGSIFPQEIRQTQGTWFGRKVVFRVAIDITDRKQQQQQLELLAHYDALTELPNRLLLADRLKQAMAQASRRHSRLAVVYLDLDGFKEINDQYGHNAGDMLLIRIASRMKHVLRDSDTLARLGGDEFVAILQEVNDHSEVTGILDRLKLSASEPVIIGDTSLNVSASIGVTFYPQDIINIEADQLIRQSDQAMYMAKQSGKNRYHIFDAAHDQAVRTLQESIARIQQALREDEFTLYYQPKVNMRTGQVTGVEALIRWQHPDKGLLSPAAFIPDISNHELMIELGNWVMEAAMQQITAWRHQGTPIQISINIDSMQLSQASFVEQVTTLLGRYPAVQANDLEFEILENSALAEIAFVADIIKQCQQLGIAFALDDFGTGYSSLTYLKRLPVHTIKVDQSFIIDLLDDPDDLAIVEGVLELSKTFGRSTVAEGVESITHGTFLLFMGCEIAQGYAIAKPMPASEVLAWSQHWQPPSEWTLPVYKNENTSILMYAIVEHRAWINRLFGYLTQQSVKPPPTDIAQCEFGKWFYQHGHTALSSSHLYEDIAKAHEHIHACADRLIVQQQAGQTDSLKQGMSELEALRDELISSILMIIHTQPTEQNNA